MSNQSIRTPQNPAIREVTLTDWHAFVIQCTGRELHPFGTYSIPFFHLSDAEKFRDNMSNLHPEREFKIFKTVMSLGDESDCYFINPLDSFSNIFERNWIAAHRATIGLIPSNGGVKQ